MDKNVLQLPRLLGLFLRLRHASSIRARPCDYLHFLSSSIPFNIHKIVLVFQFLVEMSSEYRSARNMDTEMHILIHRCISRIVVLIGLALPNSSVLDPDICVEGTICYLCELDPAGPPISLAWVDVGTRSSSTGIYSSTSSICMSL